MIYMGDTKLPGYGKVYESNPVTSFKRTILALLILRPWHTERDANSRRYRREFASCYADTLNMKLRRKLHGLDLHNENPLYVYGETVHTLCSCQSLCCTKTVFAPKTICVGSSHSFWISKFTTTMGEALIDLVRQYPTLWDKQDIMYKDSSYKEAKWKEIVEILHLNKEEVIRKMEVFEGYLC